MKLFSKLKELFTSSKKPHERKLAEMEVLHTDFGRTAWKGTPKSWFAKQWASVMESRQRRGLRTDKVQRMVLRRRMRGA